MTHRIPEQFEKSSTGKDKSAANLRNKLEPRNMLAGRILPPLVSAPSAPNTLTLTTAPAAATGSNERLHSTYCVHINDLMSTILLWANLILRTISFYA